MSQCRGLAGNSNGEGAAALAGCMRSGKGGQMFGGGCHSGGGARGQGGAMQVWLQVGCPWAGRGGRAAQRGALQCCPALQQEGRRVVVPGPGWGGSCSRNASPGAGGTVQGRDPHPGGVSRGGLGGAHGNPSLPPACSALPGRPCPAPRCSPEPPGVPVPLHAVCLRWG